MLLWTINLHLAYSLFDLISVKLYRFIFAAVTYLRSQSNDLNTDLHIPLITHIAIFKIVIYINAWIISKWTLVSDVLLHIVNTLLHATMSALSVLVLFVVVPEMVSDRRHQHNRNNVFKRVSHSSDESNHWLGQK